MSVDPVARAAAMGFEDHDPGVVIEAVNDLLPLGKDAALDRIAAAATAGGDAIGLMWVMRAMFDLPGGHPPVLWGVPDVPPPDDPSALPRFPLVLAADVPLLAVHGYALTGVPEPVAAHVGAYREAGVIRDRPLRPPADLAIVEEQFMRQWREAYGGDHEDAARDLLHAQFERLRSAGEVS